MPHIVYPPQLPHITEAIGFNSWRMSVEYAPWRTGLHPFVQYHRRTLFTNLSNADFIRTQRGLFLLAELENQRILQNRLPLLSIARLVFLGEPDLANLDLPYIPIQPRPQGPPQSGQAPLQSAQVPP